MTQPLRNDQDLLAHRLQSLSGQNRDIWPDERMGGGGRGGEKSGSKETKVFNFIFEWTHCGKVCELFANDFFVSQNNDLSAKMRIYGSPCIAREKGKKVSYHRIYGQNREFAYIYICEYYFYAQNETAST